MSQAFSLVGLVVALVGQVPDKAAALKTVAERSDYRATARYDDVLGVVPAVRQGDSQRLSHRAGPVGRGAVDSALDRRRPAGQDGR